MKLKLIIALPAFYSILQIVSYEAGAEGIWTQKSDFGGTSRYAAAGFSIGDKGYIGTGVDGTVRKDFWEWNKTGNTWTQKADFSGAARYSAVGFSIAGKGYIGTGMDGSSTRRKDFWEYDTTLNGWTQKTDFGGTAREGAVGFSIGTKGYIGAGQESASTYKKDFWEYDPAGNTWAPKTNFGGSARSLPVGFSIGNKGYIGTGIDAAGSVKNDFWEWNGDIASPTYNTWTQKANFGGVARYGSIGFSIADKGYVGVGRDGALVYKQDFWEWDQSGNKWTQVLNFGGTARNVAVAVSIGNKAYMGTGFDGSYKQDFWEWNPIPFVSAIGINPACFGQCDGTASANVSGGTIPYTYLWNNSQTTQTITGVCDGTYTITVTDADGDIVTATVILIQPALLTAVATATAVSCSGGGNGTAAVAAVGGTPAYTYSWSNGQSDSSVTGLSAGNHTVVITDANACTNTATVTITEPTALTSGISSQTNILCNGASAGTAAAVAAGGTPAYTYSWSNGQSASSANGLSAGNYTVVITDANGCTNTATVTITEPTAITTSVTTNTATCLGSNGDASASVFGGTQGYTYSWSNGQTTTTAAGLYAGTYTITVTDANGCTVTDFANVTNIGGDSVAITGSTNVSCNGGSDGSAVCTISGVNTPHTYLWNTVPIQTTPSVTGLSAGVFNITITDAAGCIDIATVTITEPPPITISFSSTNVNCNGGNDGTATAVAAGGNGPYTYLWNNGGTSSQASNLTSQTYSVTITDSIACTITGTIAITEPAVLIVSTTTVSPVCSGNCATLIASSSGGKGGYSYIWQPGSITTSAITVCPVTIVDYTVTATDIANCMDTGFATIIVNPLPAVVFTLNPDTVCINSAPFTLTGGLPNGGTYSGAGVSGGNFDPAAAGSGMHAINYFYTDSNGCADTAAALIFVDVCTGIQYSSNIQSVLFYPNPSTGMFTMQAGGDIAPAAGNQYKIEIYNVLGEQVYSNQIVPRTSYLVNLDVPDGVYFLRISTASEQITMDKETFRWLSGQKIIIQR